LGPGGLLLWWITLLLIIVLLVLLRVLLMTLLLLVTLLISPTEYLLEDPEDLVHQRHAGRVEQVSSHKCLYKMIIAVGSGSPTDLI
jgi:hypothetical protein